MHKGDVIYLALYWVVGVAIVFIHVIKKEELDSFHLWYIPFMAFFAPMLFLLYSLGMTSEKIADFITNLFTKK